MTYHEVRSQVGPEPLAECEDLFGVPLCFSAITQDLAVAGA